MMSSEKEGGEGGSGDNTLLEFSFDNESSVKPKKKRPVLSSTKNPPKRRSKKGEGEEREEERGREGEGGEREGGGRERESGEG